MRNQRNIIPAGYESDEEEYDEFGNYIAKTKFNFKPAEEDFQATLEHSCQSNNVPEIIRSLNSGSVDINCYLHGNWTALMHAAFNGSLDAIKCLLKYGADPLLQFDCHNVIMCVCNCKNNCNENDLLDCLRLFVGLESIDINSKDRSGLSALMYACSNGWIKLAEFLIEHGADIELKDNQNGETALFFAVRKKHINIIKFLLSRGADKDATDKKYETVHRIALSKNWTDVLDLLNVDYNSVTSQEYYSDEETYWDIVMSEMENGFSKDVENFLESLSMDVYKNKINSNSITFKQLLSGDKNKFVEMGIVLTPHLKLLALALKTFHSWKWSSYSLGVKKQDVTAENISQNLANSIRQMHMLNASLLYLENGNYSLEPKISYQSMVLLKNIMAIEDKIFKELDKHVRISPVDYIESHKLKKQVTKIHFTDKVFVLTAIVLVLAGVI